MSQKSRRGYCLLPDNLFLRSRDHAKKVEEDIVTTTDNLFLRPPPYKLGHIPATKCLLLLTHPYSSILPSIFFTCLSSNHIPAYTRPHKYPNNLPTPNITSLTSSFNSSQLPASHTSHTSSQISFILNPNSPFSFLKHPQDFISILLFFYSSNTLSHRSCSRSFSISFSNNGKSKSVQKTSRYRESRNEWWIEKPVMKKSVSIHETHTYLFTYLNFAFSPAPVAPHVLVAARRWWPSSTGLGF